MIKKFVYFKKAHGYKKTQNLMLILNLLKGCKKTHAKKVISDDNDNDNDNKI
jgi:hypothetical protein